MLIFLECVILVLHTFKLKLANKMASTFYLNHVYQHVLVNVFSKISGCVDGRSVLVYQSFLLKQFWFKCITMLDCMRTLIINILYYALEIFI